MKTNIIYNEDCKKTLNKIPNNSIDLVVTSPPYNMNLRIRNGKYVSRQIVKEFSTKYNDFNDNLSLNEYFNFHLKLIKSLLEKSNIVFYNISIVTGSKRAWFKIIGELNEFLKDIIIWDKGHGQPAMLAGVLNRASELILVFEKDNAISRQFKKCNFDRGTLSDIWRVKRGKTLKGHGATFPIELIDLIVNNFSNENDIIYDPFIGTGTTALSCIKNNRKYIGSELSEFNYDICMERISNFK